MGDSEERAIVVPLVVMGARLPYKVPLFCIKRPLGQMLDSLPARYVGRFIGLRATLAATVALWSARGKRVIAIYGGGAAFAQRMVQGQKDPVAHGRSHGQCHSSAANRSSRAFIW